MPLSSKKCPFDIDLTSCICITCGSVRVLYVLQGGPNEVQSVKVESANVRKRDKVHLGSSRLTFTTRNNQQQQYSAKTAMFFFCLNFENCFDFPRNRCNGTLCFAVVNWSVSSRGQSRISFTSKAGHMLYHSQETSNLVFICIFSR